MSAGLAAPDEEALRAHPPPPEPALRFRVPEPYVVTLSNGMRLVVCERHALRVVAAELVVRGGTAGLSRQPPAAVRLMVSTMMCGTQRQSEVQLYQEMNQNLIQLSPHAGDTWIGITLHAPSPRFDQALTMLHDIALEPTFPPAAIDVIRRRLSADETANADQPSLAGQRNLFAVLYGLGHPYTVALASQTRDLESLPRDAVVSAWREMMDPAQTTLIVAGDVNPLVVRQTVATLFGDWAHDPTTRPPIPVRAPAPVAGTGRIVAVERAGARQVTILYGGRSPDDSTAQSAARALVQELVEDAERRTENSAAGGEIGASWSARFHFPAAIFWWTKTVAPDQTGSALRELDGWIGKLRDREPDANELKMARVRVTRALPLWFETVERIANAYGDIVGSDLPVDWTDQFLASATALPWERIRGGLLAPDQMRVVVVGDLTAVLDQLLSLNWGAIEVHDANGRLVRTVSR
jgi:zinc protease